MIARLVDIPRDLYSSETGAPFSECLVCGCPLDDEVEYMVEKAVRKYAEYDVQDTVFEYAVCMSCYHTLAASFSLESRLAVDSFFAERVDQRRRMEQLSRAPTDDLAPWIGSCLLSGDPADSLEEYQVVAHCVGRQLVVGPAPFLIGGAAIDEITGLLSNQTIDELGGFRDEYFGLPPELEPHVFVL